MIFHIFKDNLHLVESLSALKRPGQITASVIKHKKEFIELALYVELIALRHRLADLIAGIYRGYNILIVWIYRGENSRHGKSAGYKRSKKILFGVVVFAREQHGQGEYYIFVLHRLVHILIYRVKLSRQDQHQAWCRNMIFLKIHGYLSAALFDIDYLHLIMPVQRHTREIQRYGAKVGIVWEYEFAMCFFFVIIFVF